MSGFKIPLDFLHGNFYSNCQNDTEKSISDFIKLLVSSPNGSFRPDSRFGFSLKNYRFENADSEDKINHKKIGGKSNNLNNFAIDLKEAINQFEPRLRNTEVKIAFNKERSEVFISISGILVDTKKEYKQDITFHIW